MLARAVDALKRLLVQQAHEAVTVGHPLHDLHRQLIVIDRDVRGLKDGGHLVLAGRDLVVLGLGIDTKLPQFLVKLGHERLDARADGAEVVIVHLLPLGRGRAEQRTAGQNEVGALGVIGLIDKEILLLRANRRGHALAVLAEQLEHTTGLL